jgi:hypothetical protein
MFLLFWPLRCGMFCTFGVYGLGGVVHFLGIFRGILYVPESSFGMLSLGGVYFASLGFLFTDHVLLSDGSCICLSDEVCLGFICTIYAVGAGLSIGRPARCAPAVTSHRSYQGRRSSPSIFGGTFRETEWEAWAAVGL